MRTVATGATTTLNRAIEWASCLRRCDLRPNERAQRDRRHVIPSWLRARVHQCRRDVTGQLTDSPLPQALTRTGHLPAPAHRRSEDKRGRPIVSRRDPTATAPGPQILIGVTSEVHRRGRGHSARMATERSPGARRRGTRPDRAGKGLAGARSPSPAPAGRDDARGYLDGEFRRRATTGGTRTGPFGDTIYLRIPGRQVDLSMPERTSPYRKERTGVPFFPSAVAIF